METENKQLMVNASPLSGHALDGKVIFITQILLLTVTNGFLINAG